MRQPNLQSLLARCNFVISRSSGGFYDAPELLVVQMMTGMITTLIAVGFKDPEIRKEPLVDRLQAVIKVIYNPHVMHILRDLMGLLMDEGFFPTRIPNPQLPLLPPPPE